MDKIIDKMHDIALRHYREWYDKDAKADSMMLHSFKLLNGDFEVIFAVGHFEELVLYQIIWYRDFNEFRVFCFKQTDQFDTHE